MFVRCVVINNEMDVRPRRDTVVQPSQKPEELLMPVSRPALCKDCARDYVQCGKQSGCSVANVIMRHTFGRVCATRLPR